MPESGPSIHADIPVVCIRGRSRSGKTSLAERLITNLAASGVRLAYIKRTHHELDLPAKSSSRIWLRQPASMTVHAPDRIQVTLPAGSRELRALLRTIPAEADAVLLETHTPEPYPTLLSAELGPEPGEQVAGRFALETIDADGLHLAGVVDALIPADRELSRALRAAASLHGGHACAGLVLGTRLAIEGARALDVTLPDREKRLVVAVEIDRCAADAIQAVTGCRPGRRTMRVLDYGKLAATFVDLWRGTAVRVAARGDLRDRAAALTLPGEDRHAAQRRVYRELPAAELFAVSTAPADIDQYDLPGPPRRRVVCTGCGEEVSDGRDIETEEGPRCRPCSAAGGTSTRSEAQ